MKTTPYNTGKVKIGKDWKPPYRCEIGAEMYEVQSALLGEPKKTGFDSLVMWATVAVCIVAILLGGE